MSTRRQCQKLLVDLPAGTQLLGQGERITHVFFPVTAVCSSGVIQVPGEGYSMAAKQLLELCRQHEAFRKALFGYSAFRLHLASRSTMLAATRPRVSQAAAKLKKAGIIDYRHGSVRILDRKRLEAASCECYEETKTVLLT